MWSLQESKSISQWLRKIEKKYHKIVLTKTVLKSLDFYGVNLLIY